MGSVVEVTTLVDAILSAFANGLGLFRRMRAKQRPKKSKKRQDQILMTEEEWQLQDSLQRRPHDIRTAYERSHARLGDRFAIGDSTAHTSLNHVLLVLNTGLAEILRTALSEDDKSLAPSRRYLLELSERAASNSVVALEALRTRLSPKPRLLPGLVVKTKDPQPTSDRTGEKSKSRPKPKARSKSFSGAETRRPGPDPLKRGAWIRSKSGTTSRLSYLDPSSSYIIPRASPAKNKSNIKVWPGYIQPGTKTTHQRTKSSPALPTQSPPPALPDSPRPPSYHSTASHSPNAPRRQPSLLIASPEVFADFAHSNPQAPVRPPKIPLHSAVPIPRPIGDQLLAFRPRPPSVATFMTSSTKIGEIPERRWTSADRRAGDGEGQTRQLPYMLAAPAEEPVAKRKGWGFRFWKRDRERAVDAW